MQIEFNKLLRLLPHFLLSCCIVGLFIFFGLMLFGDKEGSSLDAGETTAEEEREYSAYKEKVRELGKQLENEAFAKVSALDYVYSIGAWLIEEDKYDYEAIDRLVAQAKTPGGISKIPTTLTIHIKESWKNENEQKENLLHVINLIKKTNVRTADIIYNGSVNLEGVPSTWLTLKAEDEAIEDGLAYLSELNTVKDIEALDTLYKGYYYGNPDDFSDEEPRLIRYNGEKID